MKHICHVTTVHPRYDTRVFVKECSSLAQMGYRVTLLVADGEGDEVRNDVNIVDIGKRPSSRLLRASWWALRAYRAARKLNADIYHIHDPELVMFFWFTAGAKAQAVFDVHEDLQMQVHRKYWIPRWAARCLTPIIAGWERLSSRILAGIVSVTPKLTQRFQGYTQEVVEVKNYPLLSELGVVDGSDYPQRSRHLLYVGGISLDRGIDVMLDVLQLMPDVRLHLAGKFSNGQLEDYCKQHPAWSQVDFHGWCSREQVRSLMTQSRVGLVVLKATGDYEDALPVKLFEYMAAGLPVIASDFPLWRGIVEDCAGGYTVEPEDRQAICTAVKALLDDPDMAYATGEKARAKVFERYSWDTEMRSLDQFYKTLLND